ncbi:hypothetical protein [Ancylobacter lacus]|uniref:hypothetical protein n=1 Tax=Ancylobacter lacus TaxID=2579970 RepID=UPI001BCCA80D|nr:hypothetical protein [Ancylobacter lacus]MBS7539377.1 hypothetical protein [Ancylobacter lacus]
MNKIILTTAVLLSLGTVAANASGGRDASLYRAPNTQQQQVVTEGRNAATATVPAPAASDAYINQQIEQNARSTR